MAGTPDVSIRIGAELAGLRTALDQAISEVRRLGNEVNRVNRPGTGAGADTAINQIASQAKAASNAVKGLVAGFAALQGVQLFTGFIKQGIEFNRTLETSELGIASLIAAQSDLVDAQGKAVEGQEALAVAIGLSKQQMFQLRIAGLETAATTTQLVEAFQQAVGPGLNAGLGLDEVRQVTIQIVQAAGALGVPMNQIAQEVRAILDGSIDINARVAKSLGITNEQVNTWKAQGVLVEELNKKMGAFVVAGKAAADTFEVVASNTQEAFDSVAGEVTTGFFDSIKTALKDATSGIFDTKTLGIADAFKDLASIVKEVITLIGEGIANAIGNTVSLAQDFSAYIKQNREDLSELIRSVGLLADQFGQLVGDALSLVGIVGDVGVKTSAVSVVLQTISVLIAGVRDGFRAIGSVITWLGALIIKVVLAPLESLIAIVRGIVGLVNKEAAAQLAKLGKQVDAISARGFKASAELMRPIAEGNGAVANAIKNIGKLKDAASKAGKEQQKNAADALNPGGSVAGTKGGKPAGKTKAASAVDLPDLQRQLDESYRLQSDALKRESTALDQALEDRKISIRDYYAEKQLLAERDYENQRAQLEKERAEQEAQLAKLQAVKPQKSGDQDRINKEILKTKNDIAKVDADLVILERERAEQVGKIGREGAKAELEYQKALEDTRIALLRARGQNLDAELAQIEQARKEAEQRFAGDANAQGLVKQLFDIQAINAQVEDVKRKMDEAFAYQAETERQIQTKVELGVLSQYDAERQLDDIRAQAVARIEEYIFQLEALYQTTADPRLLQNIDAAKLKIAELKNEQNKLSTTLKNTAQQGLGQFFTDIATGAKSAGEAFRDMARTFIASIARMAAEALAKKAIMSLGSGLFAGLFHTGGMVSGSRGTGRMVSPLVFAGAPRYHSGGMVGLKPDEVPAILQKGEEVLSRADPRNAANGASGGGTRIINVIDPSLVSDYLTTSAGEKAILNIMQRNPGAVRQVLA